MRGAELEGNKWIHTITGQEGLYPPGETAGVSAAARQCFFYTWAANGENLPPDPNSDLRVGSLWYTMPSEDVTLMAKTVYPSFDIYELTVTAGTAVSLTSGWKDCDDNFVSDYEGLFYPEIWYVNENGDWSDDESIETWVNYDQERGILTVFSDIPSEIDSIKIEVHAADDSRLKDICYVTIVRPPVDDGDSYVPVTDPPAAPKPEAGQTENPFKDVFEEDYYYDAVMWAVNNGITEGTEEDMFSPGAECTRAQTVTFLWRAAGCPEPETTDNPFEDVKGEDYYYKAVLWAYENGITRGTSETTFSPGQTVSRSESVTFIYRAKEGKASGDNPFGDVSDEDFYYDAVRWAAENGITKGTGEDRFSPGDSCLRGQIITFLYRAYK